MTLTNTLATLGVWLTAGDKLVVSGGWNRALAPRLIALCRTLQSRRESRETRHLIAPVYEDTTSPLRDQLDSPERMANLMNRMAGSLPIVRWMNAEDRWAELLRSVRLIAAPTPDDLLEQLRANPQTAGLSADLLLDRFIESIEQAPITGGVRQLDAAQRAAVIAHSQDELHRWAQRNAPWRRGLRLAELPEATRQALSGQHSGAPEGLLSAPWQRTVRPGLPSQYLRHSRAPFQGSRAVLADIFRWCSTSDQRTSRLLTGPSGSGKTRTMFEVCQTLAARGWTVGFLRRDCTAQDLAQLTHAGGDRLVVIDAAENRQDTLQALERQAPGSGRLRVVALSALSGWWTGGSVTKLPPIPLRDRVPRLKIAAASYADATESRRLRVLGVPEPEKLRWPIAVQMAGVLTVHRKPLDNIPARALALERHSWRRAGLDAEAVSDDIIRQMLGGEDSNTNEHRSPISPQTMFDELLLAHLRRAPGALETVRDRRAAMTALCRLASNHPEACAWLSALIRADPDNNVPTALALARSFASEPATTPLGSILSGLGVDGLSTLGAPLRGLTIHYGRQAMQATARAERPLSHTAHTAHAGTPSLPLDEALWEALRDRLDVLLPHHLQALDALQTPHQRPLDAARLEIILRLPRTALSIELAINQLGMTLDALPSPPTGPKPSEEDAAQAQQIVGQLQIACGRRAGPADALEAAQDALDRFCYPLPSELTSLAKQLHAAGTTAGYASLIAPLQAISQSRVARWPHPDTLRIDLALHRHLHGLPHFIPPERADHPPALRILRHTVRIITGASIGSILDEILAVLSGATALQQPMTIAIQDAAARWHLEQGGIESARALLLEAASGLEQLRRDRTELMLPFVARSLHNLGAQLQGLHQDTAVDVTLSAADIWRQLSRHSGEAFLPELASTLSNLGAMLSLSGCPEDAAALLRKGVSTCWGGMTRESLSVLTSARGLLTRAPTGEAPEGLMLQERASLTLTRIEPYTRWQLRALSLAITAADPAAPFTTTSAQLRPALAETLHNLGAALGSCGLLKPAIEATTAAVAVLQSLPETTIKQAEALSNLSVLRSIDGDHEGARGAAEAAVMLLADQDAPAEHAHALSNLSAVLYTLGCHQRAALVAREAADILATPSSTKMMALFNLGLARAATGSPTEAIAALQAALSQRAPTTPPRVLDCFQRLSAKH